MAVGIKTLVGVRSTKEIKFLNAKVEVMKLSVAQIMQIQEASKEAQESQEDDASFDILKTLVRLGVTGGEELSDEDFDSFPMEELSTLSNEIMKFSGMGGETGK